MTPPSTSIYRKARPDAQRLVAVPTHTYESLGGIDRSPLDLALLSWMLGGAVVTETKIVDTPKGEVVIEPGQVWGSMDSMVEDLYAGLGRRYTRRQVRYSLTQAPSKYGLQDLGLVHPSTRGKYGKLYALPDAILNPNQPHVNVVKAYQLFHYGDPREFTRGERAIFRPDTGQRKKRNTGPDGQGRRARSRTSVEQDGRWTRGKWTDQQKFMEFAAREGINTAAFTSIGRYRLGQEGDENAPVFVPWLTIDLDRDLLIQGYEDAQTVLSALEEAGFDMARVFCSFSGRRGFHIQIATSQFGSPIFADALAARETMIAFVADLLGWYGVEYDPCVLNPSNLIRLTGSVHEKTGQRKRSWSALDFMAMPPTAVFGQIDAPFESFEWANPLIGTAEEEVAALFENAAQTAKERVGQQRALARRNSGKAKRGPVIERIMQGIAEGEVWHDYHAGRNKASFILACWLLDQNKGEGWAEDALTRWNQLNDPPMGERELAQTFRNALRTVNRK